MLNTPIHRMNSKDDFTNRVTQEKNYFIDNNNNSSSSDEENTFFMNPYMRKNRVKKKYTQWNW